MIASTHLYFNLSTLRGVGPSMMSQLRLSLLFQSPHPTRGGTGVLTSNAMDL